MKIHEYQAKILLSEYGIPVPRGMAISDPEAAKEAVREFGGQAVIKAQIHAGGRGKAGGIKTANSPEEALILARRMLDSRLLTKQTAPQGLPVVKVLVEEIVSAQKELYLSIVVDNASRLPVMIVSECGGMDIEEIARNSPEKIVKVFIDPAVGFQSFQGRKLAGAMGLSGAEAAVAIKLMAHLYRLFWEKDCSLVEINPLAVIEGGKLMALDAKINFDDNALFRHPDIWSLHDPEQEDALEAEALRLGIKNYVKLDGSIACLVNGAGLAMAALDLLAEHGGRAANFLDTGAVNAPGRIVNAFRLFIADPGVKAILVNIFGGVVRADLVAREIAEAYRVLDIRLPVVIRLAGTNLEEGKRILAESGISYIEAQDFEDAVRKAVRAAEVSGGEGGRE